MLSLKEMEKAFHEGKHHWDKIKVEIDRNNLEGKTMFDEELKDLVLTYKGTRVKIHEDIRDILPSLLHYMEKFIDLHKQDEAICDKLERLLQKVGGNEEEEDEY